jgi:hypothetical protein
MQTVRNITVAVSDDLYRQTRRLAAQYDSTVTNMVRFLLMTLPEAVEAARFPGGRPQWGRAAWLADKAGTPWPPFAQRAPSGCTPVSGQITEQKEAQNPACIPVNPPQPTDSKAVHKESIGENTAPASQYSAPNHPLSTTSPYSPETHTAPVPQ